MNFRFRTLLRLALTIIFGFVGAMIARSGTPPVFYFAGNYFVFFAVITFGFLGFILQDVLEFAGKAGIAVLAKQIAGYISLTGSAAKGAVPRLGFTRDKSQKFVNPMVVDTSALIDGRIVDVVRLNFMFGTLIVLPSVISELHNLADSADSQKRAKGRRGLDNLRVIQKSRNLKVELVKTEPKDELVDNKLVSMARKVRGKLITVDFNLSKVAQVSKVPIINVNELANATRTVYSAQDRLRVEIVAKGKEKGQGVGYLEDGTMIVVEGGLENKGEKVEVEVKRVLQTAAGKMIFAQIRK